MPESLDGVDGKHLLDASPTAGDLHEPVVLRKPAIGIAGDRWDASAI